MPHPHNQFPQDGEPGTPFTEPDDGHVEEIRMDRPRARLATVSRPRWLTRNRARLLAGAGTFVALLLVLALVVGILPSMAQRAAGLVFGPTATATTPLFSGDDLFYIAPGPTWAAVSLDGHEVTLPAFGTAAPLRLARGRHTLTWHAPPFPDQHCAFSVPVRGTPPDTCVYDRVSVHLSGAGQQPGTFVSLWLIEFFPTLNTLAPSQRAALTAAIRLALTAQSATEIVRPGERFAISTSIERATRPVQATLRLTPAVTSAQAGCTFDTQETCAYLGRDCTVLCTVPQYGQLGVGSPPVWTVLSVANPTWQYAVNGKVIGTFDAAGSGPSFEPVPLAIRWDGANWHATVNFTPPAYVFDSFAFPTALTVVGPACWPLESQLAAGGIAEPTNELYFAPSLNYIAGPTPAAGCVALATPGGGVKGPPAYLLGRFGIVLTANALARSLWPGYATATPAEAALTAGWIATYGPES